MRRFKEIGSMNANYLMVWIVSLIFRPIFKGTAILLQINGYVMLRNTIVTGNGPCQHVSGSMTLGVANES